MITPTACLTSISLVAQVQVADSNVPFCYSITLFVPQQFVEFGDPKH